MIVVPINDVVHEFRKALANDPFVTARLMDDNNMLAVIDLLGQANNCKILGSYDSGGYWCSDAIEFPSEKEYMWFLLRWSK